MKVTLLHIFLTASCISYSFAKNASGQEVLDRKISINLPSKAMKAVLKTITAETEVGFTYNDKILPGKEKITVVAHDERLGDLLNRMFTPYAISYEVIGKQIVLKKNGSNEAEHAQADVASVVSGTVKAADGTPLRDVSVTVVGLSKGTVTDENGYFEINANPGDVLEFSSVGYKSQKIKIGSSSSISLNLVKSDNAMNEVVVTALGISRQKRALGYSQEQIKGSELVKTDAPNVVSALSGKMAGVNITMPNGVDGGSTRIIIGGNNTITGDNQPLIIVDGMPMDNSIPGAAQDVTQPKDWGSAINLINPQDIDQMTVLKGPAAAALYGGRGANGVILITTKKGSRKNGVGIDYNFGYKSSQPYRYIDMQNEYGAGGMVSLNAPQYQTDADGNPILTDGWTQLFVDQKTGVGPYGLNSWDIVSWPGSGSSWGPKMSGTPITWWDGTKKADLPQPYNVKSYYRNGNTVTNNVSVSSGGDWGSLRASYTNLNNTAIIPNSGYGQNSFNLGTTIKLNKRLTGLFNVSYFSNIYDNAPQLGNNEAGFQSNLVYAYGRNYRGAGDIGNYKNPDGSRNTFTGFPWFGNGAAQYLYWNTYMNNETVTRRKMIGSVQLNYEATDFLNFMFRGGMDNNNNQDMTVNGTTDAGAVLNGTYANGLTTDIATNFDFLGTYHKDKIFNTDFSAKFSVGGTLYKRSMYNIRGTVAPGNNGYAVPDLTYFGNYVGATQNSQIPQESWYDRELNSAYAFLNLGYKNFLYLDVTARNDWSSTLPKESWSYFFPSFAASFIFSEALHIDPSVLSFGKIRAAWAEGAVDVPPYAINTSYLTGSFAGEPTVSLPNNVPATNYKPQVNQTADFGLELGFLNNRLHVDMRYYNGRAKDQLLNSPIPQSSGLSGVTVNTGVLENSGYEFIINARVVDQSAFKWDVAFNMSHNQNRLLSLSPGATRVDMANIWGASGNYISAVVGQEFGSILGYDYVRDTKTGQPLLQDAAMIQQNFGVDAATAAQMKGTMYQSTTGIVPIGNATPKFRGGITNSFTYKGFTLSALIDCKIGGQIWSGTYASMMQQGTGKETTKERDGGGLDYITPDGTATKWGVVLPGVYPDGTQNTTVVHYYFKYATYGVWSSGPNGDNWIHSTAILTDTWYKLRELSISYTIPENIVRKTKAFQAASVSLIGRDLFYLYSSLPDHINPEGSNGAGNAQGIEFASLPGVRSFGVQVRVSF